MKYYKSLFLGMMILCSSGLIAGESVVTDGKIVFQTLYSDGTTNTWTEADLVQALGLLNRKYHRDVSSPAGRREWHGKLKVEIIDEDALTKTEIYEDGTSFSSKFKQITPIQAVDSANSKLPSVRTNGIPVSLARARIQWAQEQAITNTVTKVVYAGDNQNAE